MANPHTHHSGIDLENPYNIYKWVQSKRGEIEKAFLMKGGWEGWLQVELGLLLASDGRSIVEREQHVFTDKSRAADLVLRTLAARAGAPDTYTIIELKCEGVKQDCTGSFDPQGHPIASKSKKDGKPYFAHRIEADLAKFGTDGRNIKPEYAGCDYLCIGFSLSPDARDYLKNTHVQNKARQGYFQAIMPEILDQVADQPGPFRPSRSDGVKFESSPNDTFAMWYSFGRKF